MTQSWLYLHLMYFYLPPCPHATPTMGNPEHWLSDSPQELLEVVLEGPESFTTQCCFAGKGVGTPIAVG